MNDLSWMPLMGAEFVITAGLVAMAFVFCKWGLPVIKEMRAAKLAAKNGTGCGELQRRHEEQLDRIEQAISGQTNRYEEDARKREARQALVDNEFADLKANDAKTWEVLLKVSEDTQYNIFINKDADIVERLKAFRILTALERNGDVKKEGFELILKNKNEKVDPWRQAEKYKLPVPVKNKKYWDETMAEISRRIYDGF